MNSEENVPFYITIYKTNDKLFCENGKSVFRTRKRWKFIKLKASYRGKYWS